MAKSQHLQLVPKPPTEISRRTLLRGAAALGGLSTLPLPWTSQAAAEDLSLPGAVNSLFRLRPGTAPMNAANLAPMLQPVAERVSEYAQLLNQDVSFIHRRDIVKDKVDLSRSKVARMLGADSNEIALVRNTSEANSVITNGIELTKNDEVLLWSENHATNHRSWYYRQQRQPFRIATVQLPDTLTSRQQILDAFVSRLTPHTRVVAFSELSNISGTRLPARNLCSAIHDFNPDIHVHVDGAQSWGSLEVDLNAMGCDSFSSSAHKWFMGPRGTGFLYVKDGGAERIQPTTLGYDFLLNYPMEALPDTAQRFECLGQRDVAPFAAIGDCVDLYTRLGGSSQIEQQIQARTQQAIAGLENAGIKTVTPVAQGLSHAVVVIDMDSNLSAYGGFLALHNAGIASAFITGDRVCCHPVAGIPDDDAPVYLRLSPHIYNSAEDIDRALAIIKRIHRSKFEIVREVVRFL